MTVPKGRTVKKGTLRAIIRQAGMTVEDFLEMTR
jgi:predicted RNA binding protein YcfA (HicA-like mRNA interferase family)